MKKSLMLTARILAVILVILMLPKLFSAASTPAVLLGMGLVIFVFVHGGMICHQIIAGRKELTTCYFCQTTEESMVPIMDEHIPQPPDWFAFQNGMAATIHSCHKASCRVDLAKHVSNRLSA